MDGAEGAGAPGVTVSEQKTADDGGAMPRRMDVHELLRGQRELILLLQETEYRLRVTSKGKLILTK